MIGANVVNNATHAKFVQDIYEAGHQIALHTWTHRQISLQTTDKVISEIMFNILSIYNVIGKVPRYFRPPYSAIDDRVRYILYSLGLRPVIWNIETLDTDIGDAAPPGIDISGQNVTVTNSIAHTKQDFAQKYDPRWAYFPGTGTAADGVHNTYNGFISLEHDISPADIQVAQAIVPFMAQSGLQSVHVNECDQIMPNASHYLDDNSVLVQYIKSIKLPLDASDFAAFTGSFTANPAGGSAVNGVASTTGSNSPVPGSSNSTSANGTASTSGAATTKTGAGFISTFGAAVAALTALVI